MALTADNEKIKEVLINHLKQFGYPNMEPEVVLNELKNMYRELENQNLIPTGMRFEDFSIAAHQQYMFHKLKSELGF